MDNLAFVGVIESKEDLPQHNGKDGRWQTADGIACQESLDAVPHWRVYETMVLAVGTGNGKRVEQGADSSSTRM